MRSIRGQERPEICQLCQLHCELIQANCADATNPVDHPKLMVAPDLYVPAEPDAVSPTVEPQVKTSCGRVKSQWPRICSVERPGTSRTALP